MSIIILFIILTWMKNSFAVQCNTNPCEIGDHFLPPYYSCIPATLNNVICTCPNGEVQINVRCRICDKFNCGLNGICIERPLFPDVFHVCGCTNGTDKYISQGPCPGSIPTSTTTVFPTLPPINCLNGGIYNSATGTCVCRTGFSGSQCEISIGQELCRNIICANNGVCNTVPTANNGIEIQCWCSNGFSGPNCELIGTSGRCTSNLCQNGGVCEERRLGSSLFAYCNCQPGFNGQRCETRYFACSYSGLFVDSMNCKFGRYFQCINTVAVIRSCLKGLRFNAMKMQCDSDGTCLP